MYVEDASSIKTTKLLSIIKSRLLEEVRQFKYLRSVLWTSGSIEGKITEMTVQEQKTNGELEVRRDKEYAQFCFP